MFLHRVNNKEHDIKQNICTDMDVISLSPMILYTNGQNKQTLYNYNFFRIMHSFQQTGAVAVKKQTSNMKVDYISPLNYRLIGKLNYIIFKKD